MSESARLLMAGAIFGFTLFLLALLTFGSIQGLMLQTIGGTVSMSCLVI